MDGRVPGFFIVVGLEFCVAGALREGIHLKPNWETKVR